MIALEITIISVALPEIEAAFPASSRVTVSWVFTAYNIGVAGLLLLGGWAAERLGRKRIFLLGLAIFGAGSAGSGLAPGIGWLIAARGLQAAGGALLVPSSLALILNAADDEDRDMAVGLWGAMAGLAAAVGPTLGALLVEWAGWRWVFLINLPIVLLAWVAGSRRLDESADSDLDGGVDPVAVPAGAVGVGLLVFAIVAGERAGWLSPVIAASLAVAAALLILFAWRSNHHPRPVFSPELARQRSFAVGAAGTLLFGAAFSGWLVLAPTFLSEVWGYSVLRSGLAISPAPLVMAIVAGPAGKLCARHGHRLVVGIGSLAPVIAVGWWVTMIGDEPGYLVGFLPGAVLFGAGIGVGFPMLTAASMRDVAPDRYAMGAAGNTTLRQVAMALGIALAFAVVGDAGGPELDPFKLSWLLCGLLFIGTSAVMIGGYPEENQPS